MHSNGECWGSAGTDPSGWDRDTTVAGKSSGAFGHWQSTLGTIPRTTMGPSVRDESFPERTRDFLDSCSGYRNRSVKSTRKMCLSLEERRTSAPQAWTGSTRNCTRYWASRHLAMASIESLEEVEVNVKRGGYHGHRVALLTESVTHPERVLKVTDLPQAFYRWESSLKEWHLLRNSEQHVAAGTPASWCIRGRRAPSNKDNWHSHAYVWAQTRTLPPPQRSQLWSQWMCLRLARTSRKLKRWNRRVIAQYLRSSSRFMQRVTQRPLGSGETCSTWSFGKKWKFLLTSLLQRILPMHSIGET